MGLTCPVFLWGLGAEICRDAGNELTKSLPVEGIGYTESS
jgi:hypothetical protein